MTKAPRYRGYARAVGTAARAAYKGYQMYKKIRPAFKQVQDRHQGSSRVLTSQHDVRTQYKRKRLSRGKRRQLRWNKKVKRAVNSNEELYTYSEACSTTGVTVAGSASPNKQQVVRTTNSDFSDLRLLNLGETDTGLNVAINELRDRQEMGASATGGNVKPFSATFLNYKITSAKMSLSIKNVTTAPTYDAQNIIIDVYECVAAQDIVDASYNTAFKAWNQSMLETYLPTSGLSNFSKASVDDAGQTPFNAPEFAKWWKVRVASLEFTACRPTLALCHRCW